MPEAAVLARGAETRRGLGRCARASPNNDPLLVEKRQFLHILRNSDLFVGGVFMSETFQIYCPSCNSKLNAKVSLEGQTRNCPKCKTPFLIQRHFDLDMTPSAPSPEGAGGGTEDAGPPVQVPRLEFQNRYFILGLDRVVAMWEGSKGWQVNVGSGFALARTNMEAIPDQGTFAFVEMMIDGGIPQKLQISRISSRGALTVLFRDAHAILGKLEEPTDLTVAQKDVLLRYLRQIFMSSVLDNATDVIAYLTSPSPP